MRSMEYALANLPLNDDLLKNATFSHISRGDATFTQVEYFVSMAYKCTEALIKFYKYHVKHREGKKWIGYARLLAEVLIASCEVYKLPKRAGCPGVPGSTVYIN